MKKIVLFTIMIFLFLGACSRNEIENNQDVLKQSWSEIETSSKSTKVRMFMWGGGEGINRYMDEWVAPKLKEQYNITFERIPMIPQIYYRKY